MRTEQERSQLRSVVSSPQWETVKLVAMELCAKIKKDLESKDTEWETVRAALLAEGMGKGIVYFLQELANESSYGNE